MIILNQKDQIQQIIVEKPIKVIDATNFLVDVIDFVESLEQLVILKQS